MLLKTVEHWIEKLRRDEDGKSERKRELIEKLQRDFNDELILAMELEAEAERLPYDHLKAEVKQLAELERAHAEEIARLIEDLGGEVDRQIAQTYQAMPDGEFTQLLKVEKELGERIREESNWAEDFGFYHHAKVLREIDEAHHKHMENIERVIMRINAIL